MRKALLTALAAAVLLTAGVARAYPRPGQGDDKTAPSYDLKGEALVDIDQLHKKFVDLATAMPADKLNWRPGEGVRSIGEVYLHITQANYGFMALLGAAGPIDFKTKDFEKSTTDKAKVIAILKDSFTHERDAIMKMPNADLEKSLDWFGGKNTERGILLFMTRHTAEHLGQSIAYARANGVVPPWSK